MEYKIFEVQLRCRVKELVFECDKLEEAGDREVYVNGKYADHEPFGLYAGDGDNAYHHAFKMADRIKRYDMGSKLGQAYRKILVKDVNNFLKCCNTWEEIKREQIVSLIKHMVSLNMEEELYELMMDYYRNYEQAWADGESEFKNGMMPMAFPSLYISIGDKALLCKEDDNLAMICTMSWLHWIGT